MKTVYGVMFFLCCLTACNRPDAKLKEQLINTDSIAINFFKGDGTMDTVVAVKLIRDKKVIENLSALICAASPSQV